MSGILSSNKSNPHYMNHSCISLYQSDKIGLSGSVSKSSFTNDYTLIEQIGSGGYGIVMSAVHRVTGVHVAVKFIYKNRLSSSSITSIHDKDIPAEIALLSQLNHPNVIKYIDSYEDRYSHILIMELFGYGWASSSPLPFTSDALLSQHNNRYSSDDCYSSICHEIMPPVRRTSCDLFECIESHAQLTESQALRIFRQIVQCMNDLSDINVYHRDIKDENILVDADFNVKLIDFGAAIQIPLNYPHDEYILTTFSGTVSFASPEILLGIPYRPEPAEVWSLGVLLYTLLYRQIPFYSFEQVISYPWNKPAVMKSPQCMHLLEHMLKKTPSERLSLKQILHHEWLISSS